MGGSGSGNRWRFGAKSKAEDLRTIDVRRWAREGMLVAGYSGVWHWIREGKSVASIQMRAHVDQVMLTYRHRTGDAEWKDEEYFVRVVRTACNLGGSRAWFLCPVSSCNRRVAVLYGGGIFACRRCHQLAYSSASDSPGFRALRRAQRIRARLGWTSGGYGHGPKPKWMRWPTYRRLVAQHDRLANFFAGETALKLGFFDRIRSQ